MHAVHRWIDVACYLYVWFSCRQCSVPPVLDIAMSLSFLLSLCLSLIGVLSNSLTVLPREPFQRLPDVHLAGRFPKDIRDVLTAHVAVRPIAVSTVTRYCYIT